MATINAPEAEKSIRKSKTTSEEVQIRMEKKDIYRSEYAFAKYHKEKRDFVRFVVKRELLKSPNKNHEDYLFRWIEDGAVKEIEYIVMSSKPTKDLFHPSLPEGRNYLTLYPDGRYKINYMNPKEGVEKNPENSWQTSSEFDAFKHYSFMSTSYPIGEIKQTCLAKRYWGSLNAAYMASKYKEYTPLCDYCMIYSTDWDDFLISKKKSNG